MKAAARRLASLVLAGLLIAAAGAAPAAAADLVEVIRRIKPSIVGVGTHQEIRRPPSKLLGTGFVVADGRHVVTNFHVVPAEVDTGNKERLVVFVGTGDDAKAVPAAKVAEDPEHDIAVLRIAGPALPPLALGDDGNVAEGQQIAFTGFPIGAVLGLYPVTHRGIVSARTPIAIPQRTPKALDPRMIKRLRHRFEVFQLDATAYPGNSGSPLYDANTGEVIGVVSSVFVKESKEKVLSDPSAITYSVPISYARKLLQGLGLR